MFKLSDNYLIRREFFGGLAIILGGGEYELKWRNENAVFATFYFQMLSTSLNYRSFNKKSSNHHKDD